MAKTIHSKKHERFCTLLVEARKASGMTQQDVAAKLGKPQSYVSKYETGERRLDVIEFLEVAKVVGFSPDQFLKACE
ncbi:MAG: XRE family transcriptional regulator [Rhodospirillales bacterium CG15_BIG_FIL_POST_REV_8_21_14_020_66_15]|nr:MAG: XRE family transcriptional regulator [Rhodospirillales bacterium CG15_BIG_FIL_POST_REV_8_21_14_020_66_15]